MSIAQSIVAGVVAVAIGHAMASLWGPQAKFWWLTALAVGWFCLWLLTQRLQKSVGRTAWQPPRRKKKR